MTDRRDNPCKDREARKSRVTLESDSGFCSGRDSGGKEAIKGEGIRGCQSI